MSITHNKHLNPLPNLLMNCISAKYALQILLIKGECTFLLLNILIIGFCNSSANSLLEIFSFLLPLREVFLSENLLTIEVRPFWYPAYLNL